MKKYDMQITMAITIEAESEDDAIEQAADYVRESKPDEFDYKATGQVSPNKKKEAPSMAKDSTTKPPSYSLPSKGAELLALMEAFSRLAKAATKESGGVGLPDVSLTADELTAESEFPPEDGGAFVAALCRQGYLTKD